MTTYEAVGIGRHPFGTNGRTGWCLTYITNPEEVAKGEFPLMTHHIFPDHYFAVAAKEFGLDIDQDFEEVFDIVMHEPFAGNETLADDTDPPQPQGLMAARQKHNKLGRKMRRRANRAKDAHDISGLDAIKEKVRPHRSKGMDAIEARIARLEAVRAKTREAPPRDTNA
jgi:hypothetical protein